MASKPKTSIQKRALKVLGLLKRRYPGATCELNFKNPFQLLIATILSAQCTDKAVNAVTPALFERFPSPQDLARARQPQVQALIRSIGLFRNKAKNLIACAQALLDRHQGRVPSTMEELKELPGVGRKTANVVLFNGFGIPGLPVDTHVLRVGARLGWFESEDPVEVEKILCAMLPPRLWGMCSHWLIWHGRRTCMARNPDCGNCVLRPYCPAFKGFYNAKKALKK